MSTINTDALFSNASITQNNAFKPCNVGRFVNSIPEPARTQFKELINNREDGRLSDFDVQARIVNASGLAISASAIGRHRLAKCPCAFIVEEGN